MRFDERQVMLTLSYIAFSGFYRPGFDPRHNRGTHDWIERWLGLLDPVRDQWDLVWGPATHRLPLSVFDDNMMFVVRHRVDRERYVVVVRGTNPISLANWLVEDFLVLGQWAWPHANQGDRSPRISMAVQIGLHALTHMKPELGVPGAGLSLERFLKTEIRARGSGSALHICFTGHSLGAALAPTLALHLDDTRGVTNWDPDGRATLSAVLFAGPTPGNADFAQRYREKLGARTDRITTSLDVVPLAWQVDSLARLRHIYEPHIPFPWELRPVLPLVIRAVSSRRYQHVTEQGPLQGDYQSLFGLYWFQAGYQHVASYPQVFGLADVLMDGHEPLMRLSDVMSMPAKKPRSMVGNRLHLSHRG